MPLFDPQNVVQSAFAEITASTTTTSASFVDLAGITLDITLAEDNYVFINFTVGLSNSGGASQTYFRIVIDGVAQRGTGGTQAGGSNRAVSASLSSREILTPGTHTIKIQWRTTAGTSKIDPAGAPDSEHASLFVAELRV